MTKFLALLVLLLASAQASAMTLQEADDLRDEIQAATAKYCHLPYRNRAITQQQYLECIDTFTPLATVVMVARAFSRRDARIADSASTEISPLFLKDIERVRHDFAESLQRYARGHPLHTNIRLRDTRTCASEFSFSYSTC